MTSSPGPIPGSDAAPSDAARQLRGLVVCMVGPHQPRAGGVTTQVETLSRCLRGDGVEVRSVDTNVQALRRLGRLGRWFLPLAQLVVVPVRLWRAARGADLVHVHLASYWGFYLPMIAVVLVRWLRDVPVVASYHGGMVAQFVQEDRRRVLALLRHVDALVTATTRTGQVFESLGIHAVRMHNLVELDEFKPRPAGSAIKLSLAGSGPALLWIKRFDQVGNGALMVRAFAHVREQLPNACLSMIGEGSKRAEVETLARELGAPVHFAGRVSFQELKQAYQTADVFVSSSAVEDQPNTLLEASATGLPIVATAVGGVPEMVQHGVNGLLVAPSDEQAMAQAVVRIARDPELARHLGQAAIANAREYTWPAVRPRLAAVYLRLVQRKDTPIQSEAEPESWGP